jgi:cell volume regulation protein A
VNEGEQILAAGALLAAGLSASLLAGRLRVPGLLLVLAVGMVVGSDGTGWIHFDDYELARTIGIISLALILFEGGLTAGLPAIRSVLQPALGLAIVGTLVTAALVGLAAAWLFDFSTLEGLLIGSILASTDGAAVFAVLRGARLPKRVTRTLEGEAGFNDPVAVLLVLGFIEWIEQPDYGVAEMSQLFLEELGIGLAVGAVLGYVALRALRHLRLATEGLYPVASMAVAALVFGAADFLHGSGFLAVYVVGLALGGSLFPGQRDVIAFHQGIAWVAQVAMFLTLGLLVFPGELPGAAVEGTVLTLVLLLIARPISTYISTAFAGFSAREQAVIGWAGLRGAVPVVLATFPVIAGIERSDDFFNIVFFTVLVSTVLQGSTIEPLAHRLGVTAPRLTEEPTRTMVSRLPVTSIRPWSADDGDAAYPKTVGGDKVTRQLLTRRDRPGALVQLDDGRYAATGKLLLLGSRQAVQEAARRRLRQAGDDAEAAWWREVIGACAL